MIHLRDLLLLRENDSFQRKLLISPTYVCMNQWMITNLHPVKGSTPGFHWVFDLAGVSDILQCAKLESLKAADASMLALDITAGDKKVQKVIDEAMKMFGKIDILVNNATYGLQEIWSDVETFLLTVWWQLLEIHKKHGIIQQGAVVLDLGCGSFQWEIQTKESHSAFGGWGLP
ncbi:unnamed protein product [Calypogeia fissa]